MFPVTNGWLIGVGVIGTEVGVVTIWGMIGESASKSSDVACWPHPKSVDGRIINKMSLFRVRIQVSELAL